MIQQSCLFEAEVTEESIGTFSRLSGDFNPLHNDPSYARQTEFGRPIAHGALLVGLVSRVLGMHIPGTRSLILSMKVQFPKPLFYPARVKVEGRLRSFEAERNAGSVAVTVTELSRLWPVCEAEVAFALHAMTGAGGPEGRSVAAAAAEPTPEPAAAGGGRPRLLVTGGTGGLGSGVLRSLLVRYDAWCLTRKQPASPAPAGVRYCEIDVEEPGAVERFLERNLAGGFYGVLHMSSAPAARGFASDDIALARRHWRQAVELPLLFARWARQPGSSVKRIVLVGSTYGTRYPKPALGAYSLGKAAMEHAARLLTADLSAQGATINVILPTVVPVGMNEGMPERARKALAGRMPTGRLVETGDIAGVAEFLLSNASSQINGACISVDGGLAD